MNILTGKKLAGLALGVALCASLAACVPMPPPAGFDPGVTIAWKDFTGTRRGEDQLAAAREACVLQGDHWANDRAARTMTPAARMSGYAPAMMGAIDEGRHQFILRCMRTAGWEPA